MAKEAQTCTALNLSDESKCGEEATSADGLFCRFHSKQCYGLYRGYKIRNSKLDALDASPPTFLVNSKATLRNESFAGIEDEQTLNELHKYLFRKHALLDRVIRARKLHHSRFYSLNLDYGHKAYLDKLTNDKFVVLRALERLERRTMEVLYAQQKWFKWVRERQDEEEAARVKESEVVKKEAKLFKRHWKEVEARMKESRWQEDAKRQEAFLDAAYQERLKQMSEEEQEEQWDPIEDAVEDERQSFVDMMRHLLWLGGAQERAEHSLMSKSDRKSDGTSSTSRASSIGGASTASQARPMTGKENVDPNKAMSKNARKSAKAKAKATELPKEDEVEGDDVVKVEVNETCDEMRHRLVEGVKFRAGQGIKGQMMAGTIESPIATMGRVPGMPVAEVEKILREVTEIKLFLFCRLLLSQAAILPAGLKAESVEQFLSDPEVATADLRDLCLRLEQPSLQEIRDACADFFRDDKGEGEEGLNDELDDSDDDDEDDKNKLWGRKHRAIPQKWRSRHEERVDSRKAALQSLTEHNTTIDFGKIEDGQFKNRKVRVKVCGKTVWNYPSNKAMVRGGWLHYSIIAKGSRLFDAIELCRSWEEFWELNVLTVFRYFPSPHWEQWCGDRLKQQLLQFGFIPYLIFDGAERASVSHRAGGHGQGPRFHAALECKNVIGAHIKRNDPVSRRFIQYLALQTGAVVLLVRDAKTGKVLVEPPEEHCWLVRDKAGHGRASNDWTVRKSVGEDMFEQVSGKKAREWQFGFTEYYDVIVWDLQPSKDYAILYSTVQEALIKAHRCCAGMDLYEPMAAIIKTLRQDRDTGRTRDAQPGEESIWDDLHHEGSRLIFHDMVGEGRHAGPKEESPPNWFYSDVDTAEDLILFPEETHGTTLTRIGDRDAMTKLESSGPSWKRFILDLDTDEDSDEFEDVELSKDKKGSTTKRRKEIEPTKDPKALLNRSRPHSSPSDANEASIVQDIGCTCEACKDGEYDLCEAWEDEESDDNIDENDVLFDTDDGDPETMRIALAFEDLHPEYQFGDDPHTDFMAHLDREKSKVFQKCWHTAVMDTEEREQWQSYKTIMQNLTAKGAMEKADRRFCLYLLLWLRVHHYEHKHVYSDMALAWAAMSIFFADAPAQNSMDEETITATATKKLMDNATRAQKKPYGRTFQSNLTVPKTFWKDVDVEYERRKHEGKRTKISYCREWDAVVRPVVAHWFKAGVVGPAHLPYPPGYTAVVSEPDRAPDVYMDFRATRKDWPTPTKGFELIQNPYDVDLLHLARKYSNGKPHARFALLRLWTHSHFYPLMISIPSRNFTSFCDEVGRSWEWKFIPRDMPGSEWSMQESVRLRLDRFKRQFGRQVVVKRDILLVMAKDEEELKRYAVAATFAVQTMPWRLEIDPWRSFVNVNFSFLEGLDKAWTE